MEEAAGVLAEVQIEDLSGDSQATDAADVAGQRTRHVLRVDAAQKQLIQFDNQSSFQLQAIML